MIDVPNEHILPLDPPGHNETWKDLFIYLIGGFGLFVLASIPLGLIFQVPSITTSLAYYLLNCVVLGGSAWFWGVRREKTSFASIGLWPANWQWKWLIIALLSSTILIPLRGVIGTAFQILLGGGMESLQARAGMIMANEGNLLVNFLVTFFFAGILIPISEELYFRGLLHRWMIGKMPFWLRICISSLIFGIGHFDSLGVAVSSIVHGMVAAYAYEKSRTLWLPIALHVLSNSLAIAILYAALALGLNLGI